jgi:four helix bundle protein
MAKVTRFEDLKCWQAARALVKEVYLVCEEGKLAKDFDTKAQFKKAALGSMNNIAEGFGRFSRKDFIRFLDIDQSSAIEVQSMLYVLEDINYLTPDKIGSLRLKADEARNLTLGFIAYLRKALVKKEQLPPTHQHPNTSTRNESN